MSTALRRRGGTTLEHSTFVGLEREVTVDTDKKTLVVHDGETPGGYPLAQEDHTHSAASFGVVPVTRKINGQELTEDLTIGAADKSITVGKLTDSATVKDACVTNLLHPSQDGAYRDQNRSGWLHAGLNQQWGGGQWGCEMVDGATGNLYKFDVATGQIEDTISVAVGQASNITYRACGFKLSESITDPFIWLKLYKVGNPLTLSVSIRASSGNVPAGSDLSNTTLLGRYITSKTDGEWYRVSLTGTLSANTQYFIILTIGGVAANDYILVKTGFNHKYPFGYVATGDTTPTWTAEPSYALCFLIENPTSSKLLQSGGQFDSKYMWGADTYPGQIKALWQPMKNFFDGKEFTVLLRGKGVKGKPMADFSYGLDHDRVLISCNATTGYAQVDVYDQSGTKRTVTGTTDVSAAFSDVSVHVRSKADGLDKIELFVNGVSQGTPLTGLTLTFDPLMRDLGNATLGGGFTVAPTWTQKLNMSSLPSANGWTWTGTGTEANCMSVSGGKLYQNKNGYGSTDTGYYTKSSAGLSNATGWTLEWKGRISSGTNTTVSPVFTVAIQDGTKALQLYIQEYFIQIGASGIADFTVQGDFKSSENVFSLLGKGSDYYLFVNGKLTIDGTGKLGTASASNVIAFGDGTGSASENADAIWDYVAYYTGGIMLPQAGGELSEFAYFSGDKTAYLPNLYNAGTPISVKQFTGQSKNYIGDGAVQREVRRGVTSGPTTTSTTPVLLTDMECYAVGSTISTSALTDCYGSASGIWLNILPSFDGTMRSSDIAQQVTIGAAQIQNLITPSTNLVTNIGLHKVEMRWMVGSGTVTNHQAQRNLTVEARS